MTAARPVSTSRLSHALLPASQIPTAEALPLVVLIQVVALHNSLQYRAISRICCVHACQGIRKLVLVAAESSCMRIRARRSKQAPVLVKGIVNRREFLEFRLDGHVLALEHLARMRLNIGLSGSGLDAEGIIATARHRLAPVAFQSPLRECNRCGNLPGFLRSLGRDDHVRRERTGTSSRFWRRRCVASGKKAERRAVDIYFSIRSIHVQLTALDLLDRANRQRITDAIHLQRAQGNWQMVVNELLNYQYVGSQVLAAAAD